MIKMLPEGALDYLIKVINRYWMQSRFPDRWSANIVISLLKASKHLSKSSSYRFIALCSHLSKIVERMINERLTDCVDMTNTFNEIQCAGRRHRSTMDYSCEPRNGIRTEFTLDQHCVSVFSTWKRRTTRFDVMVY